MSPEGLFVETVRECSGDTVVSSYIRPATQEDVDLAAQHHALGKCPHSVVRDEAGWMYDFRYCATCGTSLGTV